MASTDACGDGRTVPSLWKKEDGQVSVCVLRGSVWKSCSEEKQDFLSCFNMAFL